MSLVDSELEPLVLADGTKIDPADGKVIRDRRKGFVEIPSNSEAQQIVVRTRRSLADLPMPPQQLSGVALVAFYTLFGLGDQEIAIACGEKITVEQIRRIRTLDVYREFMASAKSTILETEKETVRDIFMQNAAGAAQRIVEAAESDNDVLAFKASQDILDRAGHRPADIVEHKHSMADALQIVLIKKDENAANNMPIIEAEFKEVK